METDPFQQSALQDFMEIIIPLDNHNQLLPQAFP